MKNIFLSFSTCLFHLKNVLPPIKKLLQNVGRHLPSKNPHPTEAYQSTCITSQLTGFHMRRALLLALDPRSSDANMKWFLSYETPFLPRVY